MRGTDKDLLLGYIFPSLFLRTDFNTSARIPLQSPNSDSFSPGEASGAAAPQQTHTLL